MGSSGWFSMRDMFGEGSDSSCERRFTGVGTALITPFTKSGALDEAGDQAAGAAADRRRRPLPGAVRHDRRDADAERRRAPPRRRARARGGRRPGAGAGRRRRLRHAGSRARREGDAEHRRARPAVGDAVLQQADARRPVPALLGDRRGDAAADHALQRARAAPAATSMRRRSRGWRRFRTSIGVKEASGNITQMVEICRAVPSDFLVLSGDDALTLPLMAIGGRGMISVASNAIPAEMSQMVEAAERGDFAAARQMHHQLVPLMQGNFIESNPGPVKFAMAAHGPVRRGLPAADGAAAAGIAGEDSRDPEGAGDCVGACRSRRLSLQSTIEALAAAGAGADAAQARAAFDELKAALEAGAVRSAEPDPSSPTGWRVNTWVKQGILLGFRFGDIVDQSAGLPFYDKDTQPLQRFGARAGIRIVPGGSAVRGGALLGARRDLHAADVRQHRRLRRRRHAGRFARAGRIVRADRRARAPQRRRADRRRARAGRRAAGDRRRRCAGRRQHRHLRRRGDQAARGDRRRHGADRLDAGLRPASTARSSSPRPASRW